MGITISNKIQYNTKEEQAHTNMQIAGGHQRSLASHSERKQ